MHRPVGITVSVGRDGVARAVLPTAPDAETAARRLFGALGVARVRRASDVEPDERGDGGWTARIRPDVPGGPADLGNFETRADAIAAELAYLERSL